MSDETIPQGDDLDFPIELLEALTPEDRNEVVQRIARGLKVAAGCGFTIGCKALGYSPTPEDIEHGATTALLTMNDLLINEHRRHTSQNN